MACNDVSSEDVAAEGLCWVQAKLSVQLSPAYLGNVRAGICEQLGGSMLRYSTSLGGVAIMYDHLSIRGGHGIVQSDAPVVFVPIEARLLVFAPVVGQELEATVVRHGSDHLALLAHGVINVTIPHSLIGSADQGDAVAARVGVAAGSTTVPGVRAERAGLDPPAAGAGGGVAGVGGGAGASEEKPELPAVGSSVRFVVRALHVDDGLMTVLGELR